MFSSRTPGKSKGMLISAVSLVPKKLVFSATVNQLLLIIRDRRWHCIVRLDYQCGPFIQDLNYHLWTQRGRTDVVIVLYVLCVCESQREREREKSGTQIPKGKRGQGKGGDRSNRERMERENNWRKVGRWVIPLSRWKGTPGKTDKKLSFVLAKRNRPNGSPNLSRVVTPMTCVSRFWVQRFLQHCHSSSFE